MAPEPGLVGRVIDGRYRVVERIGRGGMGSVFLVQHVQSHERYALKVLHPTLASDRMTVERFIREARAAAAFRSKHVVKIIDAQRDHMGEDGAPMPYLVMELLEGASLEAVIARRGALPPGEVVWMMRQVGKALDLAHERGIVHRDLKPENIFVAHDEEGEPLSKVCDFGIAKIVGDTASGMLVTGALSTGAGSLGTPMYMSPEQIRDASAVDARTDQWALALIAHKALTGVEFFGDATSQGNLMAKILVDPIVAPSKRGCVAGEAFDAWFLRSCARDPAARWASVGEQIAKLDDALGQVEPRPIVVPRDGSSVESATTGVLPDSDPTEPVRTGAPATSTGRIPSDTTTARRRLAVAFALSVLALIGVVITVRLREKAPPGEISGRARGDDAAHAPASEPVALPVTPPVPAWSADPKPPAPVAAPSASASSTAAKLKVKPPPSPTVVPTASVANLTTTSAASPPPPVSKPKLPKGAACARGGECASGYCFAEQCQ